MGVLPNYFKDFQMFTSRLNDELINIKTNESKIIMGFNLNFSEKCLLGCDCK